LSLFFSIEASAAICAVELIVTRKHNTLLVPPPVKSK